MTSTIDHQPNNGNRRGSAAPAVTGVGDRANGGSLTSTIDLRAGTRVWIDGAAWVVQEFGPASIRVTSGTMMRTVAVSEFLTRASVMDEPDRESSGSDLVAVVLDSLGKTELAELEQRASHVREILADLERVDSDALSTYQRKARELGVSVRTLQRWVARYRESGVAGLVDSRLLGSYSSGVDPRWDTACTRVLDSLTNDSTPTTVIAGMR